MLTKVLQFLVGSPRNLFLGAVAGSLIGLTTVALAAQDLPALRKGMWKFQITLGSGSGQAQTITTTQCTDPLEDLKKQNKKLAEEGCKISPFTRKGNAYSYTSQCMKQGVGSQSTTVITVDSDVGYRTDAESHQSGEQSKQMLIAKRVGDC